MSMNVGSRMALPSRCEERESCSHREGMRLTYCQTGRASSCAFSLCHEKPFRSVVSAVPPVFATWNTMSAVGGGPARGLWCTRRADGGVTCERTASVRWPVLNCRPSAVMSQSRYQLQSPGSLRSGGVNETNRQFSHLRQRAAQSSAVEPGGACLAPMRACRQFALYVSAVAQYPGSQELFMLTMRSIRRLSGAIFLPCQSFYLVHSAANKSP